VCEDHPDKAWGDGDACCGAPGMPCLHAPCRFADAVKIEAVRSSVFDEAAANADRLTWPCGIVVEVGRGNSNPRVRYYLEELRALHRAALLNQGADASEQVNPEIDRTDVSFHVEPGGS